MIKNYIKIAIRSLSRNKTYSFINIFGLGLGLATGFVMLLWVNNEYSMNRYHANANRIYQVNAKLKSGNDLVVWENTPAPLAVFAKESLSDIETTARLKSNYGARQVVKYTNTVYIEDKIGYTENEFFKVFDFPVVKGNARQPLSPGLSVVMTETTAKKYFGDDNPIGKIISFRDTTCQVSAVIKDFPVNSSIRFDMLFSIDLQRAKFRGNGEWKTIEQDWGNYDYSTFCLVKPRADLSTASAAILAALKKANPDAGIEAFPFRPLKNIYLYKTDGSKGRVIMVEIFFIVAVFVLLIACINYVNLVTARATQRVKEISIRKIIGAEKKQIFIQFFIETGVLLFLSAVTSLLFVKLLLPVYQQVSGDRLSYSISSPGLWKVLLSILGLVWVATGLYPALLLSSFNPFRSLRGSGFLSNAGILRKGLVVLQFVVSITLLLGTVFIHRQMNYVQEKDLHISTDNVLVIPVWKLKDEAKTGFMNQLQQFAAVSSITSANTSLFEGANTTTDIEWAGKPKDEMMWIAQMTIDRNFLDFFKARIKEGSDFSNMAPNTNNFIINETAARKMGMDNPVGQTVQFHEKPGMIIGVAEDFYFQSFHNELMPAIITYAPEESSFVYAKVQQKDARAVTAYAQKLWKQFEPVMPLEYSFLDDKIALQYEKETKAAKLFDAFTIITLFISCMGLFGLATHSAERRVKEIGIRKVLGANITQLAALLSKEFVVLVLIALAISIPLVFLGMDKLLNYFAYRISLQWWVFMLAGAGALLAAILTVSFQAVKAAIVNPVKSLRTE